MELKMCTHSFQFVKLHTSNYMYSGTQRMIELALFTIVRLRLCMIEKVIYKTKFDEYIGFIVTATLLRHQMSHFADVNFCCVSKKKSKYHSRQKAIKT